MPSLPLITHSAIFPYLRLSICYSVLLAQSKQMLSARAVKVAHRVLSPSVRCRVCRLSRTLPSSHIYDSQSVILSCWRNPNRCCPLALLRSRIAFSHLRFDAESAAYHALCHLPIFTTLNLLCVLLMQSKQMLSAQFLLYSRFF